MNNRFPDFCTTLIGSMPRSEKLLELKALSKINKDYIDEYNKELLKETKNIIDLQIRANIDIPICGELDRDNFVSYVAEHVNGVALMNMNEILEITADSDSFNESLQQMDASDNSMSNPICIDKIDINSRLNQKEVELMSSIYKKAYKMTIPSPYILTRSMWLKEVSKNAYKNRKELGIDVVKLLLNEIEALIKSGIKVIQIDEPIISEVVFQKTGGDNSFY